MAFLSYLMTLKNFFLLSLTGSFFLPVQLPVPVIETIILKAEPLKINTSEFYIAAIQDDRAGKQAIATLQIFDKSKKNLIAQPVEIQGGSMAALKNFINNTITKNPSLRPVTVRLKECKIMETASGNSWVDGRISISIHFDIKRAGKTLHTLEYKGGARYRRTPGQISLIEPAFRQALVDGLQYLNTWMNREADRNVKLATGLNIHIKDVLATDEDTVFYQVNRPLTWNDFKGQMKITGPSAAAVFPGFSIDARSDIKKGIIHVYMDVKVYMVKNNSWVKSARDAYALNHEQRHFDIVKIVAERFKKRIQPQHLTLENYDDTITREYFAALEEIKVMQEKYDGETRHSINVPVQESWNQRIDADLRALSIIK